MIWRRSFFAGSVNFEIVPRMKKKKKSRVGKCKLCLRRRVLKRSHLMPAALYAMTLRQGGALGNPVLVTHQGDVQTSRQYWSHLLCGECEERLNRNGERYAMTQVDNGQGRFPLFDRLNVAMPREATPEISLYSGRDIGIDVDQLAYFAMSIFWRGSVHRWPGGRGGELHTPLGVYEEPVRRYLMGGPFPDDMVLVITVCTDGPSQGSFFSPAVVRGDRVEGKGLMTRGIHFRLYLGQNIPQPLRAVCCMRSAHRIILMGDCRRISFHAFANLQANRRP